MGVGTSLFPLPEPGPYRPLTVETSRSLDCCEITDARRIIIDLSGVSFMDSTGLKVLLRANARSRAGSDRLEVIQGSRRVQRAFELTNTEQLLPFSDAQAQVS